MLSLRRIGRVRVAGLGMLLATAVACVPTDPSSTPRAPSLEDTYGTVDGQLTVDDLFIAFGSGIAYGDSFFHGGHHVLVFTEWPDSQCGAGTSADTWEGLGTGWKLDVAFNEDGNPQEDESTLWRCEAPPDTYGSCTGFAFPTLDLSLTPLEPAVGEACLLYTSPSPRDGLLSRMPSSA